MKRLKALARRYGLPETAVAGLAGLLDFLEADAQAPTTVREPSRAVDAHVADSLVALDLDAVRRAGVLADLGAGAGFPGLPLALALPETEVHLVESNGRKCAFLERAVHASGAANARVVKARAEEWSEGRSRCDVVVARALAPLAVLAEYAAPLLAMGGSLVAWKGRLDPSEVAAAGAAAEVLGLGRPETRPVTPYPGVDQRHLVRLPKRAPTPDRFPRRAGMARKRPLGGALGAKSAK